MRFFSITFALLLLSSQNIIAQRGIHSYLPKDTIKNKNYIFYLAPRVIEKYNESEGIYKDRHGTFEYDAILTALGNKGFNIVISGARPKLIDPIIYSEIIVKQIDTLLKRGIGASKITVIGADKGALIAMFVSSKIKHKFIKYILLSACDNEIHKDPMIALYGQLLSIYDISDPYCSSCWTLFQSSGKNILFKEYQINTGNAHAYTYSPLKEWIELAIHWINS